jgi:nucleotide-binding universal stress UspA family protein
VNDHSTPVPFVRSIFHPSDFSGASEAAFAHALAVALLNKCELSILHADRSQLDDWSHFPQVRKSLEHWGVLPPGSPRSAVFEQLGVRVTKVNARGDPVGASLEYIYKQNPDLVVLATRGSHGLPQWLKPSVAQAIAHRTDAMTLFVPRGCRGIVSMDGIIRLRRILLPVDHQPDPQEAAIRAVRAAEAFGDDRVEIVMLQVNNGGSVGFSRPQTEACSWKDANREGDVVLEILAAAQEADLIVMATEGRHGIFDALRGSVTERVIHGAPCPVLAVPAR